MHKKVAVITGASSGLGRALSHYYRNKGYVLVLSGRNEFGLKEFQNEGVDIVIGDLTKESTRSQISDIVYQKHKRIDLLINNAGIIYIQPFEENTEEQFDAIFDINVKSHMLLTQKLYPLMKQQRSGHIINIVSSAGREAKLHHTIYCATKYAMSGFTDSLRLEAKQYNIKVTGIYPGGIKTPIFSRSGKDIDVSSFMNPEDVAEAIGLISETHGITPDSLIISRP